MEPTTKGMSTSIGSSVGSRGTAQEEQSQRHVGDVGLTSGLAERGVYSQRVTIYSPARTARYALCAPLQSNHHRSLDARCSYAHAIGINCV